MKHTIQEGSDKVQRWGLERCLGAGEGYILRTNFSRTRKSLRVTNRELTVRLPLLLSQQEERNRREHRQHCGQCRHGHPKPLTSTLG